MTHDEVVTHIGSLVPQAERVFKGRGLPGDGVFPRSLVVHVVLPLDQDVVLPSIIESDEGKEQLNLNLRKCEDCYGKNDENIL